MNKRFEEIQRLNEQLDRSKGMEILKKKKLLSISYNIFMGNYRELKKALDVFQNPRIAMNLTAEGNRKKLELFLWDVTRLFHNYLAGAKTLVDHARALIDELYSGHKFLNEYNTQVKLQFGDSLLSNFIQVLRNYMVHKGLPLTSTRLMFRLGITSETNKLDSFVMLKIKNLRNWKKWSENKKAKEYLETLDDTVRLDEIVESYRLLVVEFYKWFDKRQEEIHKKEFEEVKRLQNKMKLLLEKENTKQNKLN